MVWGRFHRGGNAPDGLGQLERDVLHHVVDDPSLGDLIGHLGLPKSSMSVLVKRLERRGYLTRYRDPLDERRLVVRRTAQGDDLVRRDTLFERRQLARALSGLDAPLRDAMIEGLEQLAQPAAARRGRAVHR